MEEALDLSFDRLLIMMMIMMIKTLITEEIKQFSHYAVGLINRSENDYVIFSIFPTVF